MAINNVRRLHPDDEAAILGAFGSVVADQFDVLHPSGTPQDGDPCTLEDLRFGLRGLVDAAGSIYRSIVRLEREEIPVCVVDCDCADACHAAGDFARAVREAVDRAIAYRREVGEFKQTGEFTAAQVLPAMTQEQFNDAQQFAKKLAVDRRDDLAVHHHLQPSIPNHVLREIAAYDVSDPTEGPDDDEGCEFIPSPAELKRRIAAVRASR